MPRLRSPRWWPMSAPFDVVLVRRTAYTRCQRRRRRGPPAVTSSRHPLLTEPSPVSRIKRQCTCKLLSSRGESRDAGRRSPLARPGVVVTNPWSGSWKYGRRGRSALNFMAVDSESCPLAGFRPSSHRNYRGTRRNLRPGCVSEDLRTRTGKMSTGCLRPRLARRCAVFLPRRSR